MTNRKAFFLLVTITLLPKLIALCLLGNCTALTPDEGTYVGVFLNITTGQGARSSLVWAQTPIWLLKLFFAPAEFFHFLGFSALTSMRLSAILLSESSAVIIFLVLRKNQVRFTQKKLLLLISVLSIPTVTLWSISGLRESFLYISIAGSFYFISSSLKGKRTSKYIYLALYGICIALVAYNKLYVFQIFAASVIAAALWMSRYSGLRFKAIALIFISVTVFIFSPGGKAISHLPNFTFSLHNIFGSDPIKEKSIPSAFSTTLRELEKCRNKDIGGPAIKFLAGRILGTQHGKKSDYPSSSGVISNKTDLADESHINGEINIGRLPTGILMFLLVPPNLGSIGIVGAYGVLESVLWFPLYWILGYLVYRTKRLGQKMPYEAITPLIFIFALTLFSALTEVNFGTALRHRSVLITPVLISIYVIWNQLDARKSSKS